MLNDVQKSQNYKLINQTFYLQIYNSQTFCVIYNLSTYDIKHIIYNFNNFNKLKKYVLFINISTIHITTTILFLYKNIY